MTVLKVLSLPTTEVIELLADYKIIDCGAGQGTWVDILQQHGIDAIGIDPKPSGIVKLGSHLDLNQYTDRLLLIVWPPDGTDIGEWIKVWNGKHIAICGKFARFFSPEFNVEYTLVLPAGYKGHSVFKIGTII